MTSPKATWLNLRPYVPINNYERLNISETSDQMAFQMNMPRLMYLWLFSALVALAQTPKPTDGQQLGIQIMGTIAQKGKENNVALIKETNSGKVSAVKVGYIIRDLYKVTDIQEKYITVITKAAEALLVYQDKFAGEFRAPAAPAAKPGAPVNPEGTYKEDGFERTEGRIAMTGTYRDKIVHQDLSKILMQATAEPFMTNGQIVGFKLTQIDADSIFAKGGLRDNDVVTAINDQKLNNVAGAIALLKGLKDVNQITVEILRGGSHQSINIQIN